MWLTGWCGVHMLTKHTISQICIWMPLVPSLFQQVEKTSYWHCFPQAIVPRKIRRIQHGFVNIPNLQCGSYYLRCTIIVFSTSMNMIWSKKPESMNMSETTKINSTNGPNVRGECTKRTRICVRLVSGTRTSGVVRWLDISGFWTWRLPPISLSHFAVRLTVSMPDVSQILHPRRRQLGGKHSITSSTPSLASTL